MIALAAAALAVVLLLASPAQAATVLVDRPTSVGALPFDGVGDSRWATTHSARTAASSSSPRSRTSLSASRRELGDKRVPARSVPSRLPGRAGQHVEQRHRGRGGIGRRRRDDQHRRALRGVPLRRRQSGARRDRGQYEIYVKDLSTGTIELASRGNGAAAPATAEAGLA